VTVDKVVDASALAAIAFNEPGAREALSLLHGANLVAPELLRFEVAHICVKKIRQRPAERELILAQHASTWDVDIALLSVDQTEIVHIADKLDLPAYDASYLWLAHALGAELVTLDKKLRKAAEKI
jgi:predicted nucleic acid-binding protein